MIRIYNEKETYYCFQEKKLLAQKGLIDYEEDMKGNKKRWREERETDLYDRCCCC